MKSYRKKFTLIGQLTAHLPEFQIRVITPNQWVENFQELTFEPTAETNCHEIPLPVIFSGYASRFVYQELCRGLCHLFYLWLLRFLRF